MSVAAALRVGRIAIEVFRDVAEADSLVLERINELFESHSGLAQDRLKRFRRNCMVVRDRYARGAAHHPNVGAMLSGCFEAEAAQCSDHFRAGNIAR